MPRHLDKNHQTTLEHKVCSSRNQWNCSWCFFFLYEGWCVYSHLQETDWKRCDFRVSTIWVNNATLPLLTAFVGDWWSVFVILNVFTVISWSWSQQWHAYLAKVGIMRIGSSYCPLTIITPHSEWLLLVLLFLNARQSFYDMNHVLLHGAFHQQWKWSLRSLLVSGQIFLLPEPGVLRMQGKYLQGRPPVCKTPAPKAERIACMHVSAVSDWKCLHWLSEGVGC